MPCNLLRRALPGELLPGKLLPGKLLPGELLPGGTAAQGRLLPAKLLHGQTAAGQTAGGQSEDPRPHLHRIEPWLGLTSPGGPRRFSDAQLNLVGADQRPVETDPAHLGVVQPESAERHQPTPAATAAGRRRRPSARNVGNSRTKPGRTNPGGPIAGLTNNTDLTNNTSVTNNTGLTNGAGPANSAGLTNGAGLANGAAPGLLVNPQAVLGALAGLADLPRVAILPNLRALHGVTNGGSLLPRSALTATETPSDLGSRSFMLLAVGALLAGTAALKHRRPSWPWT